MKTLIVKIFFVVFFILILCFSMSNANSKNIPDISSDKRNYDKFKESLPISINGELKHDKYCCKVNLVVLNTSNQEIAAIKFIATAKNVYSEIIENKTILYEYNSITINDHVQISFFMDRYTKYVEMRVYSIYYKNNCIPEWGDRKLSKQDVLINVPICYSLELRN